MAIILAICFKCVCPIIVEWQDVRNARRKLHQTEANYNNMPPRVLIAIVIIRGVSTVSQTYKERTTTALLVSQ